MNHQWHPIADYESEPSRLEDKELRALSGVWLERRSALEDSQSISKFTDQLKREWAIETGLIERLYALDRGITELLIEHGVKAALIPHNASDKPPAQIAAMIGDQADAVESVFAFVRGERTLSTSYVKELHALFTRNQEVVEGRDPSGKIRQVRLIRGDYKRQPNNPMRPDGSIHPYCPPEQVASEMDRLIELHVNHHDVAPEVEAAWLHHRFTQIHPFQDGNGRIARALATLVFIKANWLPLVVRDSKREEYIKSLESADGGNLKPLVSFFSKLQREEFIRAIGIARDTEQAVQVNARIESIRRRIAQRQDTLQQEWDSAIATAHKLHQFTQSRLEQIVKSLQEATKGHNEFSFYADNEGNNDPRSHYFQRQIISTARKLNYYANTRHYRSWVRLVAKDGNQGNLLFAFHCVGHDFQGVLACSGTWFLRARTDEGGLETGAEAVLNDDVFQINYKEAQEDALARFEDWLESAIERGLAFWESAI